MFLQGMDAALVRPFLEDTSDQLHMLLWGSSTCCFPMVRQAYLSSRGKQSAQDKADICSSR